MSKARPTPVFAFGFWLACVGGLVGCPARPTSVSATRGNDVRARDDSGAAAQRSASTMDETQSVPIAASEPDSAGDDTANRGSAAAEEKWEPSGSWTAQRMIALAETGPVAIDLMVSVGEQSLSQASSQLLEQTTEAVLAELKDPPEWKLLLDLPLLKSGWLGNLVPDQEQREQLISLYDTQRDGVVGADELPAFLTRGLSRERALQVSDIGNAPDLIAHQSPWGKGDRDGDFCLDTEELKAMAATIAQQDVNADGVVTRFELTDPARQAMSAMQGTRSTLLRTNTLMLGEVRDLVLASGPTEFASAESKAARKLSSDLLRHYTFLVAVERQQWSGWSDAQWNAVDANADQKIDRSELQQLLSLPAQATLYVKFPTLNAGSPHQTESKDVQVHARLAEPTAAWRATATGGELTCRAGSLRVDVSDGFSPAVKRRLRLQLEQSLVNPQIQTFVASRLQLQPDAFEVLDRDGDARLSDAEFEQAWQWLTVRQGTRLLAKWMLSSEPWFQLTDTNADARLSELELQNLAESLAKLDRDADQRLSAYELPLVATLEVTRADSRLDSQPGPSGSMDQASAAEDWFAAMDTNRDASISFSEFLGEPEEFSRLDRNRDGFVARGESELAVEKP